MTTPTKWPKNPELFERFSYVCPFSGCTVVTWEWCGVAGWKFISNV